MMRVAIVAGVVAGAVSLIGASGCGIESRVDSSTQALPTPDDAGPSPEPGAVFSAPGAMSDAGVPTVDQGAPGATYPAAHPAMPRMTSRGGPVIATPHVVPVTFNGDPYQGEIETFSAALGATPFWSANVAEYGVGAMTARTPIHLTTHAPILIDDDDVQDFLRARFDGTHPEWGTPDESSIYEVHYPGGTVVTLQGYVSCLSFGGYHSEVKVGSKTLSYAVIPRCPSFLGLHGFDVVTVASSHELIEAVTDPRPYSAPTYEYPDDGHIVWGFYTGGESGDMCTFNDGVFYKPKGFDFTVQRSWSNVSAAAGHDPCVPALPGRTYFNSAPVLNDVVKSRGVTTRGVKIPAGTSRTVELDLYSDGPTDPWSITAVDLSVLDGGKQVLDFAFDKKKGSNGDKIEMTITVLGADPQYDGEGFVILSELNGQRNVWYGFVGN